MLNKTDLEIIDRKEIEELIIEMTYLNQTLKSEIEPIMQNFEKLAHANFSIDKLENKIERLSNKIDSIHNMNNDINGSINELNKKMLIKEKNINARHKALVNNLSSKLSKLEHKNKFYEKYLPSIKILGSKISSTLKEHTKQIEWIAIVLAFILGWLINDCNMLRFILGQ